MNISLTLAHIDGRDVITSYETDNPSTIHDTLGWHKDFNDDPIRSAVICMRVWTVLNQDTLFDIFDQCEAGVTVRRMKR